jgi:hypothetical protein
MNTVAVVESGHVESVAPKRVLAEFKGVLVSDFYAPYDTLDCPKQKCLIHLMRDLNSPLIY